MLSENIDIVFLAGGRGSRISKLTKKTPKPLIKFNNIPFFQYLLNHYSKYNFNKIYILAGYKSSRFNIYKNKKSNLIPIECIKEKQRLGTGGALFQLKKKIKNDFILVNSDSFIDVNLDFFLKKKLKKNEIGKIITVKNKNYISNQKLSSLKLDKNNVIGYNGKLMNAGIYYFKKEIFKYSNKKKFSIETELLPKLINNKKIIGVKSNKYFIDIGTYSNLNFAKKTFCKLFKRPSIFLDRDGVINSDKGYVHTLKKFQLRKNVLNALKYLNNKKINIFIVTNQAGIAKNYFTENTFIKFQRNIKTIFEKKNIFINDIEYCPYHTKAIIKKYKKKSLYRKPGNLMIEKIKKKWGVDLKKSYMIGDKRSDYLAAKKSKLYFEYVESDIFKQIKKINKKFNF